jgi:hypothetical protein
MGFLLNNLLQKNILLALLILALTAGCKKSGIDGDENKGEEQAAAGGQEEEGFVEIFDGESLDNWQGDSAYWSVRDGRLIGQITPTTLLKNNSFIVWQGGSPGDFELKAEFRISETGNSGIQYRSEKLEDVPNALRGYQADIDGRNNYTGQNYEERGRTTLAYQGEKAIVDTQPNAEQEGSLRANVKNNAWTVREVTESLGNQDSLRSLMKSNDWNTCHIIAKGNRLQHFINGVLISDVTDNDTVNRKLKGMLGVQVHVGPPMKVEYRNIRLKEL